MKVNIVRLDKDSTFPMPTPSRGGDAGIDLIAANGGMINPGDIAIVGCGFSIEIPEGFVGLVCPRSGLSAKYHISVGNAPGVIDAGYRGEVKIILEHRGHRYTGSFQWRRGDRLAQLVIVPYAHVVEINEVDSLSETARGIGGFGSTGIACKTSDLVITTAETETVDEATLNLVKEINKPVAKAVSKKSSK